MRINHNLAAINANRNLAANNQATSGELQKLSSGLRINSSADDAAGLAISEKMRSQIRGLDQSTKNINDAISLVQTAEGGMTEVHDLLQRGRELSVQAANGTLTGDDQNQIQEEISKILEEINGIAEKTEFNTKKLLNSFSADDAVKNAVINGLKSGWLSESASLISTYYGLTESSRNLTITLVPTTGDDALAYVASSWSVAGNSATLVNQNLTIDLGDFAPATGSSGSNGSPISDDRIIAHEMVHAIMADAMGDDFYDMPTWFKEGTAEFIPGADERLKIDVTANGIAAVVNRAVALIGGAAWSAPATSLDYSASYLAVKYINSNLNGGTTFADLISGIDDDNDATDATLTSIVASTSFADVAALQASLTANGATFYGTVLDVDDADTGSIAGSDYGGPVLNDEDIIATGTYSENPTNYNVIFPSDGDATESLKIQVGANSGQNIAVDLFSVKTDALGIGDVNVSGDAEGAITSFDNSIRRISSFRATLGAVQNKLEHALNIDRLMSENTQRSESQIRDVDMADSMMEFTKMNILSQSTQAMLAQANQQKQGVLQLLGA